MEVKVAKVKKIGESRFNVTLKSLTVAQMETLLTALSHPGPASEMEFLIREQCKDHQGRSIIS